MIAFVQIAPGVTLDHFGLIPTFLRDGDTRPAREQFAERYAFGGGWNPNPRFLMLSGYRLKFPGDPPLRPAAALILRQERIVLYPHSIVAIIQPDGSFEACRMD